MTPVKVEAEEVLEYADYLTSTAAEEARYATRRGDYYLGSEVAPADGVWHELGVGGAQVLGLDGQRATRERLVPIWRNRHPATGEQLVREGADGSHVAGVDMTFSPPKDFSILWALADERERALLEQLWARSVRQALEHVLREIPLIRRGRGGCIRETAAAIQAAEWVHHTARVTEEAARDGAGADPQVHSHVVISNVARRHDGRLAAIASHPIMAHQHEIGAIQSATLAALLREQGYEVVPRGDAWAIAGISDRTRDWFSKREAEVLRYEHEDALRRGRPLTKAERRAAVKASRGKKDVNPEGDFVRWLEEEIALAMSARDAAERGRRVEEIVREARRRRDAAAASGLDVVGLTLGTARPKDAAGLAAAIVKDLTAPQPTAIGTLGPDKLTADSAVFDELELRKGIARGMQAVQATALDFGAIRDAVHRARELTRIDPRTRDPLQAHWTTTRHLETERRVLGELEARARSGGHGIGSGHVEAAIAGSRYVLSTEQRAATRACCDAHGLRLVAAEAGTGKGKGVGRAVADAYRSAGYRIVAVSTAGQTADEFGRDVAAAETRTIDSLARRGEPLPHDTLVLVDEGGQVDTVGRWTGLLDVLGEAKCVVLGDERQLSAVTPGGIFATAQRTVPTSRLTEVHRHPDPEVVAIWRLIRNGQGERAARELYERGMLALEPDRPAVIDRLVRRWEAQHLDGDLLDVALLTDTTNREVDLLNRRIQARREELGELLGTPVPVRWQDPQVRSYVREEALRTGDAVKTVRSVWLGGARELVRNGEVGRVTATRVDGSAAQVRFGDRVLWFGPRERDALRLAYATHQQSGQGMTVDAVGGLLGGLRTTRLEGAYVQASRSRRDALLVADLDTLQVPEEVVAVPAGEVWAEQRERLSWEQRVALGLKALGELLSTSDAKETAIDALAREEARERAARELEEREGRAQPDLSSVAPPTHTPATPKQLAYAAAVGAEVPDFATWVEASVAIDAATAAEPGSWVRQLLAERGVAGGLVDDAVDLAAQRTGVPPPSVATTARSQHTATANGVAQAPVVSGTEPWHGVPGIDERRELAGVPREAVTDGAELRVGDPRLMARSAGMGREATDGDGRVREEGRWTSYDTLSPADRAATDAMAEDLRARLRTVAGGYRWERYRRELDDPGLASLPRLLRNPLGMDADAVAREIGDRLEQVERLEKIWDGIRAALGEGSVRLGDGGHAGEEVALWSNLLCAALPLAEDPGLRPALAGMIVDLACEVGPPVAEGWIERQYPAVAAWAWRLRETGVGAGVLEERAARGARVRDLDRRWRGALEGAWGDGHEAVWEALIAEVAPHRDDPALGPAAAGLVADMARTAGGPVVGDGFERLAPAEVAWAKGLAGAAGQEDGMGVIGTARERLEMDRQGRREGWSLAARLGAQLGLTGSAPQLLSTTPQSPARHPSPRRAHSDVLAVAAASRRRAVDEAIARQPRGEPPERLNDAGALKEEWLSRYGVLETRFLAEHRMTLDEYRERHGALPPETRRELEELGPWPPSPEEEEEDNRRVLGEWRAGQTPDQESPEELEAVRRGAGWVGQDAEVPPSGAALEAAAREELAGAMAGVAGPSGPEWIAHAQRMLDAGAAHRGDLAGAERELDLAVSEGVARGEEAGAPVESLRPAEDELLTEQPVETTREELAVSEDRLDTLRAEATRSGDRLVAEIDRLEREVAEAEAEGRDASTAERRLAEAFDELARRGEEAERAEQAATAREARSAHLEEDGESLVADVVTRQGAEAVMAAGARLDEGDGAARRVDRGVGDAGRSAGSAPGDGSGGGGEGTDGDRWPLADPSGRSLAERPDYAWEAEFLDLVGGWRDPLAHRPERGWQRGWVDLGGNRWDWERYDEWRARQEAERGSGRREEEPEPWQWTYRGPRPHWMGKDTTREEQEAASPLGPTGWGYRDVPVNLGRLGPVWTQGGYYEPRLSPEQQAELRETFDKYHDWERWDLAFHDDGFERLRTSWDADVEWRDPDGRMQTLPMRVGEMEAWYRREQEINLEASERLWDALRQQYRERYWVTPVEGEPRAIVDAARPDAEVDRAMAAWREAHGWVEPRLARPPTEDELHARAEAEERALFAALREMHVGDPWAEALVDAVQARCDMTTSRIDARGARPGETVDEWLARTSPERAVERGPSGRVEPPEVERREETHPRAADQQPAARARTASPGPPDEDVDAFLRDPDAWDGWPDPGRVQVMTEAIEALVAADRPALPTGDAQPSAVAAERRGEGVRWAESLPGAGEGEGPEEAVRSLRSYEAEGASGTLEDHAPAVELEDDDVRGVGLVGGVPPRGVSEQGAADLEAAMDAVVAGEATGAPVADGDDHDVARASAGDSLTAEDDLLDVGVPPDHLLEADDAALRSDEERAEADRTLAMSADEDERGDRAEAEELAADEDGRAEMQSHTDEQALTSPGPDEAEPEDERAADADPATDALEALDDTALPSELADEIALPSEEAMAAQDGAEWEASTSAEMAAEEEDEMEPSGGMEEDDDWD